MKLNLTIETITSKDDFASVRECWSSILERIENTNPFIEFEWVWNWWKYLAESDRVEIIAVIQNGQYIGFVPFTYKKTLSTYVYEFVSLGQANYMGIVAEKRYLQNVTNEVFNYIISKRKHVVFCLHGLLNSEPSGKAIEQYCHDEKLDMTDFEVITPFIDLQDIKLDEYADKRKRLHRLERREKRLYDHAEINIKKSEISEVDRAFELYDKRWRKRRDTSGFTNPKERQFFTALLKEQREEFKSYIDGLYLDDHMIAFSYSLQCRGRSLGYVLSYDDDFEVFSPGRILEKESIVQSKNGNSSIFDLSIGYEPYKFNWNTDVDYTKKMIFSSPTIQAKIVRAKLHYKERMIEKLKENPKVVRFVRNDVGKWMYNMERVVSMTNQERLEKLKEIWKRLAEKCYKRSKYIIYKVERKEISYEESKQKNPYVELTLKDVIRNPNITGEQLRYICQKFYGGSKGYYPEGNLSMDKVIWLNDRVLRIDRITYLEQFRKSSVAFEINNQEELSSVVTLLKKESNARNIYVAIEAGVDKHQEELERFGFAPSKTIKKKIYLGNRRLIVME